MGHGMAWHVLNRNPWKLQRKSVSRMGCGLLRGGGGGGGGGESMESNFNL